MINTSVHVDIAASPDLIWSWVINDDIRPLWLHVHSRTGPLVVGKPFSWQSRADFDAAVGLTGRVLAIDAGRALRLEVNHPLSGTTSTVSVQISATSRQQKSRVTVEHTGLPTSDLGLFVTTGFRHYWRQHLATLREVVEKRAQDHTHRLHTGFYFIGSHPGLGLLIGGVRSGSPAQTAGAQAGDILSAIEGNPVRTIVEYDSWLDRATPGSKTQLTLARGEIELALPALTL